MRIFTHPSFIAAVFPRGGASWPGTRSTSAKPRATDSGLLQSARVHTQTYKFVDIKELEPAITARRSMRRTTTSNERRQSLRELIDSVTRRAASALRPRGLESSKRRCYQYSDGV